MARGRRVAAPRGVVVVTTVKATRDLAVGDVVVARGTVRFTVHHTVTEVRGTSYGPHLVVTDKGAGWPCAGGMGSRTVEVLS